MEGDIPYGDTARTFVFIHSKSTLIHPFELTVILVVHFVRDAMVKTWIKFAHTGGVGHPWFYRDLYSYCLHHRNSSFTCAERNWRMI